MKRSPEERKAFVAARAVEMRHTMTPSETKLWEHLKSLGFQAQVMLCGKTKNGGWWQYIADFLDPSRKVIIEVDGGYHKKQKGRDRRRDKRLMDEGILTYRVRNEWLEDDVMAVIKEIKRVILTQVTK